VVEDLSNSLIAFIVNRVEKFDMCAFITTREEEKHVMLTTEMKSRLFIVQMKEGMWGANLQGDELGANDGSKCQTLKSKIVTGSRSKDIRETSDG
jgi:hypothetical protein